MKVVVVVVEMVVMLRKKLIKKMRRTAVKTKNKGKKWECKEREDKNRAR